MLSLHRLILSRKFTPSYVVNKFRFYCGKINECIAATHIHRPNKKRDYKNKKYGFGGQKKRSKHNTAKSAASMGGYSAKKHGTVPAKYQNKNKSSVSVCLAHFISLHIFYLPTPFLLSNLYWHLIHVGLYGTFTLILRLVINLHGILLLFFAVKTKKCW